MDNVVVCAIVLLMLSLTGCSSGPKPQAHRYYSDKEVRRLTYCFGMTDTVMYVAREKLKQRPSVQLIDYYESRPNAKLNIDIVKKVYAEQFSNAWDYTLQTFNDCARHFADVSEERANLASICEQNTLIADVAYAYRKYGYSRQKTYKQFSGLKGKAPKQIVDKVYDSDESRGELKIAIWNQCMAKINHE